MVISIWTPNTPPRLCASTRAHSARDADQRAFEERQRNVDPFAVDPLERWREQQRSERTVPPPRERQPTIAEIEQLRAADWNAWLRGHLDQERSYWESVIAEVIARERRDADAKVAKLETRIAVLEAKQEHGIGEIIDLPSPISRRRRDA